MANASVRLPDDWRRFDRTALTGAIILPLILAAMWLTGLGPWDQQACQTATLPLALDLARDGDKITLAGKVATPADRAVIANAAEKVYGKSNVIDKIEIDPAVKALTWASGTGGLFENLKALDGAAKAKILGSELTLEGMVPTAADRASRARDIAALLGKDVTLKNLLVVKPAEAPKPPPPAAAPAPVAAAPPPEPAAPPAQSALGKRTLPGGKEIDIPSNGFESQIIGFIEDPARPIDKGLWFDFDRLQFKTASSELTSESKAQVEAMAAILNAYPNVAIKVGGYTDNVGDPDANMKLSAARAERVTKELIALGISSDRLEWEGYGEQHPIADNATADGRAKNRRTAVSVRKK